MLLSLPCVGAAWLAFAPPASEGTQGPKGPQGPQAPWIERNAPTRNMVELGIFGGVLFPAAEHELFQANVDLPEQGYKPLALVTGAGGARFAYLPSRYFGLEIEGAAYPGQTEDGAAALLWGARGHVVAQLGRYSVTPFIVAGIGAFGVSSSREALGDDVDFTFHFGGGLKVFVHRVIALRFDVRDIVSARRGVEEGVSNSPELNLGLSFTLGRRRSAKTQAARDADRDGFVDPDDRCPDVPGVAPDGCPIPDTDGDGFLDPQDACPSVAGVAPDGCPIPDTDNDGFPDPDDACPEEPGAAPDGCPLRDSDDDGFVDTKDHCVQEPETRNGFEDEDGCPDRVPTAVETYTGIIEGIFFDSDRATIRSESAATLDAAVAVLKEHPSFSIEVSGHTDNRGDRLYNMDLSARRADAVREYLIQHGVEAERIETRGAGPDEPIDSNHTAAGRAKNRRIEFHIVQ